jgi:xylan 1,4-beta-xylosidase
MELTESEVVLRIETVPNIGGFTNPSAPPDVIRLGVERPAAGHDDVSGSGSDGSEGEFVVLGELDGRYLSTEVAGGFTGRVIGMFGYTGSVSFDWFEYQASGS